MKLNHAMVYSRDVAKALAFYRDHLGLKLLEEHRDGDSLLYARLRLPKGKSTIALHQVEKGQKLVPGAIRLYFEVSDLAATHRRLKKAGVTFTKPPKKMPWGWKHAYLNDPDGHEISLYEAGELRLRTAKA